MSIASDIIGDGGFNALVPGADVRVGPTARGVLDHVTFVAKDLIDIAGYVTGGGNPDWQATHEPATTMAPAPAALLAAGATLVGKAISDELAFSLEGAHAHYGTPVNVAAPGRLPGGSSSGSAAAVAARLADVALGTDTGGSVRVPAAFCGVFGIRPTHGRVSTEGVIAFGPSFDTVGWFARSSEMLRRVGSVLLGGRASEPITRLILAEDIMEYVDAEIAKAVREAIAAWPIDGTIRPFGGEPEAIFTAFRTVQNREIWKSLGPWITETRPRFGTAIEERFDMASKVTAEEAAEGARGRESFRRRIDTILPPGVAIVFPTTPCLPPKIGASADEIASFYLRSLTINALAGLAGLPQVTLPVGESDGVPVGVSVLAARGHDEALLDLACRLTDASSAAGARHS